MPTNTLNAKTPWKGLRVKATWEAMQPYAEAMDYEPNGPQLNLHKSRARFKVPTWGRRCGKTTACGFESNFVALMGGWVMNVAPTYKLADKCWSESVRMLEASKFRDLIDSLITQEGKQRITLKTGGIIQAFSTENPKGLVGDGWDLCVFDEAALEDSREPWSKGIRPALIDKQGAAIFPSTPRGLNWYYDIFMLGQNPEKKNWWSEQKQTGDNPINTAEEIASMIEEENMTADDIQQEIYAKFLGAGSGVFREYLEAATAEWQDEPIPSHIYCAGLDLGKSNDFTVLAIWDASLNCLCHLLKLNLMPYPQMMRKISPVLQKWRIDSLLADATREAGVVDKLAEDCFWCRIEPIVLGNDNKTKVMNQLELGFEQQSARILNNHSRLGIDCQGEFGAYRIEKLASGKIRMSAPPGKHDDIVVATALAYACNLRFMGISLAAIYNPVPNMPPDMAGTYTINDLNTVGVATSNRNARTPFSLRRFQ